MRNDPSQPVLLADYHPPDFLIDTVHLDVALDRSATRITAQLAIRANPLGRIGGALVLDGDELQITELAIDGKALERGAYEATPSSLIIHQPPPGPFQLSIGTLLDPSANTKLMGLYRSGSAYCTQCEAEGFRRITYFLDRPDVLSVYTVRMEAETSDAPVLLANGNPVESGDISGTSRHYAIWHDPWPKPSYLFAMVGGDLARVGDRFVTASGREVELGIYVEHGKEGRCGWAMDALKRSMRWDERVFGREYDLDVFNIVAVSDFNMGAMENKGLNVFNDKYVLAEPQTATDADYAHIEAIIAHEYFHNWTGNRITCRDWFQLCLKEGLTVFRDQEFSADERSRPVKRIADVRNLRAQQFTEDAGPLAHCVRPESYQEINNFYTATVYEKGAELVRMIKTLMGEEAFRRGMELYFERFDGTAATVEDFLFAFEQASGTNLSHFARWYSQAGTPVLTVKGAYDAAAKTYRLELRQATPPTPGQSEKKPLVIPISLGLVAENGRDLTYQVRDNTVAGDVFTLTTPEASLVFSNVEERPVPSLLRGFSAPVRLDIDLSNDDLLTLFRYDSDPFNRWQSAQTYATRLLMRSVAEVKNGGAPETDERFVEALDAFLNRDGMRDPAYAAQVMSLPSEADIARDIGEDVDPDAIFAARQTLRRGIGKKLEPTFVSLREALHSEAPYSPDAASAGRRSLRNAALDLLVVGEPKTGLAYAKAQFDAADNLTDRLAALSLLCLVPQAPREEALAAFAARYADEPLVLDKWFTLQASIPEAGTLDRVRGLFSHPAFSLKTPNRVRALVGGFASANPTQFHRPDGEGYRFLAETVLTLDLTNPQLAARLLSAFRTWRALEPSRREHARAALVSIADKAELSRDVRDIVTRSLG